MRDRASPKLARRYGTLHGADFEAAREIRRLSKRLTFWAWCVALNTPSVHARGLHCACGAPRLPCFKPRPDLPAAGANAKALSACDYLTSSAVAQGASADGSIHVAELHWYEAAGIGRKEFKIKHLL